MPYEVLIHLKKFNLKRKRQLLRDHSILHAWWASLKKGKKLYFRESRKPITKEVIIERHRKIVETMKKAGLCHFIRDDLDETLPKDLIEFSRKCMSALKKRIRD